LERAVDALGGITIEVPCPIIDNFHDSRTETGWRKLAVDAGPQHLEGITAAMYARSRHGRTDWNRARRQQAVLLGMRDRFLSIDGMTKLPELWDEFESAIATDMRRIDVFRLARRIARTDAAHLHGLVLGHVQTETHRTEAGRSVLLPNYEAIDLALSKLFSAPLPGTPPRHAECEPADVALKASAHGKAAAHADPAAAEAAARSLPVSAAALPATAR
jgi:anionic cell wall polymer biosynthesis LytR-Cps2A-Psr (LCP) family protein